MEDIVSFKKMLRMDYDTMLCNMIKVCTNVIKVYVSLKMLKRPSNISERVQKCYMTFKGFYNMLYGMFERFAPCLTFQFNTYLAPIF